jgi:lactate permease
VAITGVMLMALGFSPLRAAAVVLLANTAPVAFGAVGTPIITAGNLTGIPYQEIGAYVGHQTPILAAFVPLLLVLMADGRRGVRQTWPIAVVVGLTFAIFQWISATWISVELTDIIASLAGLAAAVLFLKVWQPSGREEALETLHTEREREFAMAGGPRRPAARPGPAPSPTTSCPAEELEPSGPGA